MLPAINSRAVYTSRKLLSNIVFNEAQQLPSARPRRVPETEVRALHVMNSRAVYTSGAAFFTTTTTTQTPT